jgi:hypothetical protein
MAEKGEPALKSAGRLLWQLGISGNSISCHAQLPHAADS